MTNKIPLEVANKMLPLIRPIVSDIVQAWKKASEDLIDLQDIYAIGAEAPIQLSKAIRDVKSFTRIIVKRIDELEQLGCFIESFMEGIVDFPSQIDKMDVMLCWKLGEEEIRHYHKCGETISHRLLIKRELE